MDSGEGSGHLTDQLIAELAVNAVAAKDAKSLAQRFMKITAVKVSNMEFDSQSAEELTRSIFIAWRNQSDETNKVKALAHILYGEHGLVDPFQVKKILGVSREDAARHSVSVTSASVPSDKVTEDDLRSLADLMRRGLKKKIKITQYPWQKSTEVDMDKLFVKLIVEKQTKEPDGRKRMRLECYLDLFDPSMIDEGERILLKGEPGMGKTTLLKKITHDWVKGRFTDVSVVFFVMLKLVKPGEAIENVIVNQTPVLKGCNVTPDKVKRILEKFGSRYLLVLDGLDEHALGKNKDVVRIIEESKHPHCKVIVTSRPHSTRDIEEHFGTIGRVEGFTENEATKFTRSIVNDQNKVKQILEFSPTDSHSPMYKVPILLSFMCFLVKNDNNVAGLLNKSGQKGWIYFRMVRCLYVTYVEKIGINFVPNEFIEAVRSVGKLAWQTLLSGNPMFRKKDLGLEVFAYGLLVGDEDPEGLSDETADILVTFSHRSIQEFFGAFYFILSLSEGESIDSLLGGDCKKPIFIVNPLFLEFCLWLLHSSDDTFSLSKEEKEKEKVREILVIYLKEKIDKERLDLKRLCRDFPALDTALDSSHRRVSTERDWMVVDLMKDVLSRCSKIEYLALPVSYSVDELLSAVNPDLWYSQIHTLELFQEFSSGFTDRSEQQERDLQIYLCELQNPIEVLPVALKYCHRAERRPCNRVDLADNSCLELSELIPTGIHQLDLIFYNTGRISCDQDVRPCPSLRRLSVNNLKNSDHVLSALGKAIQGGHLPNLNYLDLSGCSFETEGFLHNLFGAQTPALEYLRLWDLKLNKSDLQFISELRTLRYLALSVGPRLCEAETVQFLFPSPQSSGAWNALSELSVSRVDLTFWENFVRAVNKSLLPNLEKLHLSYHLYLYDKVDSDVEDISFLQLQAEKLPRLKSLYLGGFINSEQEVQNLAQKVVKWDLEVLQIIRSKGISGNLSVLFGHCFPSLVTLDLRFCELNSDNMRCLGREQVNLPKLKTLNVSNNHIGGGLSVLFHHCFPSLEALNLWRCELNSDDMRCLGREQVNLPKLKKH